MSLSKYSPTIRDLPLDVICLVFEHLPLSEVLRTQSLVCKVFYEAHRQYCRSSVKSLTLVGQYMVNISGHWRLTNRNVVPQNEDDRKLALFKFARSTGTSSHRTINSSTVHLKLIRGREEVAYEVIGTKFKSITHLELCQLAFERHYKQIAKMIIAWDFEGGFNQLTDFKIFFNKEHFDAEGKILRRGRAGNRSRCFAYLFGEGLTPDKAPALRRVTLVPANVNVYRINRDNHNDYSGPHNQKVDLSALESINAVGFSVCQVPKKRLTSPPSKLRDLTIEMNWLGDLTSEPALAIFRQLSSLTISLNDSYDWKKFAGTGAQLKSLSLKNFYPSRPLSELVQELIAPLTTTNAYGVNHSLEHLRIYFEWHKTLEKAADINVSFQALTSLHLVKTDLLHSEEGLYTVSALFPNIVHLRLDGNYSAWCISRAEISDEMATTGDDCRHCRTHITTAVAQRLGPGPRSPTDDIQFLESSTADDCKAAFVRRAMAAFPKLVIISLQIEDFYKIALENHANLKYLYMSETIVLRDAATREAVPEAEWVWKVEKVPY